MEKPTITSLTAERDELSAQYTKLKMLLLNPLMEGYTEEHRRLVRIQSLHVKIHRDCLNLRIKILEEEEYYETFPEHKDN